MIATLTRSGVEVVDAAPDTLPPRLADAYLALKAAGRLARLRSTARLPSVDLTELVLDDGTMTRAQGRVVVHDGKTWFEPMGWFDHVQDAPHSYGVPVLGVDMDALSLRGEEKDGAVEGCAPRSPASGRRTRWSYPIRPLRVCCQSTTRTDRRARTSPGRLWTPKRRTTR